MQPISSDAVRLSGPLKTPQHASILAARRERQARRDAGEPLRFLAETEGVRAGAWKVAPLAADLLDRRVEITGPVDRKMIVNALNSGASVFMAVALFERLTTADALEDFLTLPAYDLLLQSEKEN